MIALPVLLHALGPHLLGARGTGAAPWPQGILLAEDGMVCEPGMAYVGEGADISRLLAQAAGAPGCALFAAGGGELPEPAPGTALAVTDLPVVTLYNTLSRAAIQYQEWEKTLLGGADSGLNGLLQAASALFGFSAAALDAGRRLLAQSILEADRRAMTLDANGPTGSTAAILDELEGALEGGGRSSLASLRRDGRSYLLTAMRSERGSLGYLLACAEAADPRHEAMLLTLAHVLFRQATAREAQTEQDAFQSIAVQFLGEYPGDMDALQKELEQLPQKPPRFMRAVVIRQLDEGAPTPPAEAVRRLRPLFRELRELRPRENIALLPNYIFLLTGSSHPETPAAIMEDRSFEEVLERHKAFAMVSNPSQWLRNLRRLTQQAFRVLPAAAAVRYQEEEKRRCLKFDRYAIYYLVHLCEVALQYELSTSDIIFLCDTGVLTLTRYDRTFNSNLRDTLFTFLTNNCSISETSRKMFVHRNTVIYKLNLIRSLIGDKMDSPDMRTQLVLSCMIIRYVENYRREFVSLPPFEKSMLRNTGVENKT